MHLVRAFTLLWGSAMVASLGCCSPAARTMDRATFEGVAAEYDQQALGEREARALRLLSRMEYERERSLEEGGDGGVIIDALLLSSGGQFGAFGVGVLEGWGKVPPGELSRPEFDIVTGVSTGAMIAPFALSGTDYSISRISDLYRQADDRLAILRGLLFFLPSRDSFFDNAPLRERIAAEMDMETIDEVTRAHEKHRMLLVGSVNLDIGRFRIWDMGEIAAAATESGDARWFHEAMLSSASIPAAFPPVKIDGMLYADGAAATATFLGLDRAAFADVVDEFRARHPDAPTPRFRLWMIVNGRLDPTVQLVERRWVSIASRSVAVLAMYSLRTTLRQMQLGAELLSAETGAPVEFRYVAIPDGVELPESSSRLFDRELMARVHALGRGLGEDPQSWRREAIAPDIPGSGTLLPPLQFDRQRSSGPRGASEQGGAR
jgi:predicted acylesterase/phospholipase RssA